MNLDQAKALQAALSAAIAAAEQEGRDQVELGSELQSLDDQARAELAAAVARAKGG